MVYIIYLPSRTKNPATQPPAPLLQTLQAPAPAQQTQQSTCRGDEEPQTQQHPPESGPLCRGHQKPGLLPVQFEQARAGLGEPPHAAIPPMIRQLVAEAVLPGTGAHAGQPMCCACEKKGGCKGRAGAQARARRLGASRHDVFSVDGRHRHRDTQSESRKKHRHFYGFARSKKFGQTHLEPTERNERSNVASGKPNSARQHCSSHAQPLTNIHITFTYTHIAHTKTPPPSRIAVPGRICRR
eukprot:scaffold13320_cov118-Isochrysis_galbana.AAC.2